MIEIENLRVEREGRTICAVDKLTVAAGERLALLGANGSGKTTLLRVIAGLSDEYSGHCRIAVDHQHCTYVHQQPYLFRGTVLSNVQYGEQTGAGQGSRAAEWLEKLGIAHLADRPTADLSGGECRRVALARALATEPKLLLLDEPLADLDDEARATVVQVLAQLTDTTVVIASPTSLPNELVNREFTLL